jgi:hypothetical protein
LPGGAFRSPEHHCTRPTAHLPRAKARLDRLRYYPRPVSIRFVHLLPVPWLFRLPGMRRYDGYALPWTILLRDPPGVGTASDDLICHELCHVWQMQHHPLRVFHAWLTCEYESNPFEVEAREAVEATRITV